MFAQPPLGQRSRSSCESGHSEQLSGRRTLCLIWSIRAAMAAASGSGPFGIDAHVVCK